MKQNLIRLGLITILILSSLVHAANIVSTYNPEEIASFSQKLQADKDFQEKLKSFQEQELADIVSKTSLDESNIWQSQQELGGMYGELQNIQQQFDAINSKKKDFDEKISNAKNSIQLVLDQAKKTQASLSKTLEHVTEYTKKIKLTKEAIDKTNKDKETARVTASRFLDILYRLGNELYSSDQEIDDIKLLLKSENIAANLSRDELFQMLTLRFDQLIQFINEKQDKLKRLLTLLEDQHLQYKSKLEEYQRQLDTLNQQKQYLVEFMTLYSSGKDKLLSKESDLQKSRQQLVEEIKVTISKSKDYLKSNAYLSKRLNDKREDGERFFSRPLYPIEKIEAAYNNINFVSRYSELNQGIDIISVQGKPVYAPADGFVYEVKPAEGASLSYVIIVHDHGYSSFISTLNAVTVSKGQFIERGQLIGTVGGEPGTRGAGFASPGPRIHYEIYKDGVAVPIFSVTDLSSVKNTDTLPTQYNLKVLKDKMARKIDLSTVSYIQGATLEERTKNYINKYGNAPFDSYIVRKQAAAGHKIPLELGVCIAVAETSFGRAFASKRNVGNVGNNDRGDRIDFSSPIEGASVIYYALENEFLGKYPTLDKLSGYGNNYGAIYASSPINRQTNIIKCLAEIYGYRPPDDFPVRLYQTN